MQCPSCDATLEQFAQACACGWKASDQPGQLRRQFCHWDACTVVIGYGQASGGLPTFCRWHRDWAMVQPKTGLNEQAECEKWQQAMLEAYPNDQNNPIWGLPFPELWLRLRQAVK